MDKGERFISKQVAGYTRALYWCAIQYIYICTCRVILWEKETILNKAPKISNKFLIQFFVMLRGAFRLSELQAPIKVVGEHEDEEGGAWLQATWALQRQGVVHWMLQYRSSQDQPEEKRYLVQFIKVWTFWSHQITGRVRPLVEVRKINLASRINIFTHFHLLG